MKLVFCVLAFFQLPIKHYQSIVLILGVVICLMGLFRQKRGVEFTKAYWAHALCTDFGQTILYLIMMFGVDNPLRLFCLPVSLLFALGFAEFLNIEKPYFFLQFDKVKNLFEYLRLNKNDLKKSKLFMEFFLFVYSLFLVFVAGGNLFTPIFLMNFLKIRKMNPLYKTFMDEFFGEIGNALEGSTNPVLKGMSSVWKYFIKLFGY